MMLMWCKSCSGHGVCVHGRQQPHAPYQHAAASALLGRTTQSCRISGKAAAARVWLLCSFDVRVGRTARLCIGQQRSLPIDDIVVQLLSKSVVTCVCCACRRLATGRCTLLPSREVSLWCKCCCWVVQTWTQGPGYEGPGAMRCHGAPHA